MPSEVQLKTLLTAEDKTSGALQSASVSFGKLTGAIALGNLAAQAFTKVTSFVVNEVKSSINAYGEAQAKMVQVDSILKTMNTNLADNAQTFADAGKMALQKAFDDETAQVALANLFRTTKDMKFAQEALNSAMDLARDRHIGLEEATKVLNLAFNGNVRALKPYGIELADTASAMDVLRAVQGKTSGEAIDFSKTWEGSTKKLSLSVENLKETIGGAITSGIGPYINALSDSVTQQDNSLRSTNTLGKGIYQVIGAMQTVVYAVKSVGLGIGTFIAQLDVWRLKLKNVFSDADQEVALAEATLENMKIQGGNALNSLDAALKKVGGEGYKEITEATRQANAVNKDYTAGVLEAIKSTNSASKSAEEHAKAIENAKAKISDFRKSAIADFQAVKNSIATDLLAETKKYNDERLKTTTDASNSIANIIVSKQDMAAELLKKINDATTDDQRASLQAQLDDINGFLNKHAADIAANFAAIKNIRDNDLTDEIEKIKNQTALKLKEMDDAHAATILKIEAQMDAVKKTYSKKFQELYKELKKSKLLELLSSLGDIGATLTGKNKTSYDVALGSFINAISGKAEGGPVSGGISYLVGERGPELFTPSSTGNITPNSMMGGATVTINNPVVRNDNDIAAIGRAVQRVISRQSELVKMGA